MHRLLFFPLQNLFSLIAQSHRTKHQILNLDFSQLQREARQFLSSSFQDLTQLKTRPTIALSEVKAANARLKEIPRYASSTAIFTGATRGLGLATLKSFARHIQKPTAIIVGRNRAAFAAELQDLHEINPNGTYTFLESEVSLIRSIDSVSEDVRQELSGREVDMLFLSQGYLNFAARQNNLEGLDTATTLRYYGRVRFMQNLLPLMSSDARVVSILAGGKEGKIFESDLDLERNYSLMNCLGHFTTLLTLSHDTLAAQNPLKSFLHVYPGFVNTGVLARSAKKCDTSSGLVSPGVLELFFRIVEKLSSHFNLQPEEVGERMLHYATSEQYEQGSWSLDWDGTPTQPEALEEYRERAIAERVEEHNSMVFERVSEGSGGVEYENGTTESNVIRP